MFLFCFSYYLSFDFQFAKIRLISETAKIISSKTERGRNGDNKKKETLGDFLIKIGGDLLFHNRFESREQSHACMSFAEMKKRERS